MNRFVALTLLGFVYVSLAFSAPSIVSDEAGILSTESQQTLESIVLQWTKATQHQMAIVTVKSLEGISIEEVAVKRFEALGIGRKGANDGLLFLIAPNDKNLRIEVGYGLEGTLPDGPVGSIRDKYIVPFFKTAHYDQGILAGTLALLTLQAKNEGIDFTPNLSTPIPSPPTPRSASPDWGGLIFIIIMVVIVISSKGGRSGSFWPLLILSSLLGGGGRYDDRGGFGGFGGGGFGGFGGGMSGGGGASGSW